MGYRCRRAITIIEAYDEEGEDVRTRWLARSRPLAR